MASRLIEPSAAGGALIEVLIDACRGYRLSLAVESSRERFAGHLAIHPSIVAQDRRNVPAQTPAAWSKV
ncbi:hypothetical protein LRC484719_21270 [Mycobacterium riyadhense]